MSFGHFIRQLGDARRDAADLSEEQAHALFSAILDGGVPDLELGALLTALRAKGEALPELLGFHRAVSERLYTLERPATRLRPLVIPTYGGARIEHNLLPLLALLLRRLNVPILFHGTLEGGARVASVYILREFGVLPSATIGQAQATLEDELIAFVPTAVLCPGLAGVLSLRSRLGVRNSAHIAAKLIDPFSGDSTLLASASAPRVLATLTAFFLAIGGSALLLASTEGEAFANPRRRPRIEWLSQGERTVLFEEEAGPVKPVAGLPSSLDAHATAQWIREALAGEAPIPHPIVNQLAGCLFVSGYTDDMNQAKAIAAVEAGSLAASARRRSSQSRAARAASR
jgi:anthranilate phosphoribosyltransferase